MSAATVSQRQDTDSFGRQDLVLVHGSDFCSVPRIQQNKDQNLQYLA